MSASRFCENCGATLAAKARFCEACGSAISTPSALTDIDTAVPSGTTPRPIRPRWLIVGSVAVVLVIVCLAALAVGGFFYFQSTARGVAKPTPVTMRSPSASTPMVSTPPLAPTSAIVPPPTGPGAPGTLVPVPSITPATGVATPTLPAPTGTSGTQPTFSSLTFSSAFDQSALAPINLGKTFPYGAMIIYASWTYSGVSPNTSFDYDWYRNGAHMNSDVEKFLYSSGKLFQWRLHPNSPNAPKIPLDPGTYTFVVRVDGQVMMSDSFVIQAPPNTFVLFFTILNDGPVGYVVDKQGVRRTPMGPALILQVAPGDRIIMQTDQPRFSLLFDCGTSPKTFTPCDFVADTTASMPAEIRKNTGGTAYLNISRADNWAGTRSGFPSQRYPADPILRIGFGD